MVGKSSRKIEFDLMRIIACLGVIMIHADVFNQLDSYSTNSLSYQGINIWGTLSRWAVPAFVMLSGMFVIPKSGKESLKQLFVKRVIRMVVAYIVWSAIYSFYNVFFLNKVYSGTKIKTFLDGCFSGETHMWYLLMLAGLYIISPLLNVLLEHLSDKMILYWIGAMFVFTSIIPFIDKVNIRFISTIISSMTGYMDLQFLCGWTLYFVLGYVFSKRETSKNINIIIGIVSAISFVFTFIATVVYSYFNGKAYGVLDYMYPNIVLYSVGIFFFFKDIVSKINFSEKIQKIIVSLSSLTFGIYLIHYLVLEVLCKFGINITMFHPILSIPVLAVITFCIGGLIVWLIRKIPKVGKYIA